MRLALAAIAVFSLLASACGGVESEPNLAKAVDRTTASGSSRIEARATDPSAEEYTCDGIANYTRGQFRGTCKYAKYTTRMIGIDGFTYLRIGGAETWAKFKDDADDSVGGFSPDKLLSMLRAASSEIVRIGEEDVRGTPAVRYRLTVDPQKAMLGDIQKETQDVDVWIDEDGLVRRVQIDEAANAFVLEFYDFGVEVDIQAPPADRVEEAAPDVNLSEPKPCTPGAERPFRIDQVRRTLRKHGFEVENTEDGCVGGVAAILTNARGDDRNFDELLRGPGHVTCFVLMKPNDDTFGISTGTSLSDGANPQMTVETSRENLECTLFAQRSNGDDAEERLYRALDELKRTTP